MGFCHTYDSEAGIDHVSGPTIEAAISRTGAEVIGLTWKHPVRGRIDVIWRNNIVEPPRDGFWRRHAPTLFPIVGGIHDNKSATSGGDQVHFGGLHGFLRNSTVALVEASEDHESFRLTYSLAADAVTKEMYPWNFMITISYTIMGDRIEQVVTVVNCDVRDMPFQLGWHPGINVPLVSGLKKNCHLRLPQGKIVRMLNNENCHLTGESVSVISKGDFDFNERELELTYMFDVSMLAPEARVVELFDADFGAGVRVGFPDYPHLGVWSDADAPFICIEPWQGMDDSVVQESFDHKFGMVMLPPGASDTRTAWISLIG